MPECREVIELSWFIPSGDNINYGYWYLKPRRKHYYVIVTALETKLRILGMRNLPLYNQLNFAPVFSISAGACHVHGLHPTCTTRSRSIQSFNDLNLSPMPSRSGPSI